MIGRGADRPIFHFQNDVSSYFSFDLCAGNSCFATRMQRSLGLFDQTVFDICVCIERYCHCEVVCGLPWHSFLLLKSL